MFYENFSIWKGVDGQKVLSWEIYVFLVFSTSGSGRKISILNQYYFLWVWISQTSCWFSWKVGFSEKWGEGGSQTLNWSVGASRDFCVRPKPKLATCVQTPGPSMAACWRSPLIRALCNQEEQLSAPISNPPLWLRPVSRILPKHIYSLVLTLTSALMRNHISWFQTWKKAKSSETTRVWLEQNMVTTLCIDCPPERRWCH